MDDDDFDSENSCHIDFTPLPGWANVYLQDDSGFIWSPTPGVITDGEFIYPASFTPLQCGIEKDFAVFDLVLERDAKRRYGTATWDFRNLGHEVRVVDGEAEVISTFDIVVTLHSEREPETLVFEGYNRIEVLPPSALFSIEDSAARYLADYQRELEL